jgi:hypothetical protein
MMSETCPVCGLTYCAGLDSREHDKRHAQFIALSKERADEIGPILRTFDRREEEKHTAWKEAVDTEAPMAWRFRAGCLRWPRTRRCSSLWREGSGAVIIPGNS